MPGRYSGSNTVTEYFVISPSGNAGDFGPETEVVRWVTVEEAAKLIGQMRNAKERARDLKLLQNVSAYQSTVHGLRSRS